MCNGPKLTIAFSGAKIYGVLSMIVCPYPQLLSMKSKHNPLFPFSSYPQYWHFLRQIPNCSEEKLFTRQDAGAPRQSEHIRFVGQIPPVL
jgi:hypothetical protein